MHATQIDPRRIMVVALAALALTVVAVALITALGNLEFGVGAGSSASATAQPPAATWVNDPIASPLTALQAPITATP
jgi:hypothetical protein